MAGLSEREVYAKTLYGEARGESERGQEAVAWVIKNRANKNRDYWGGGSIKGVCLKPGQFECWNGRSDIEIKEPGAYDKCSKVANRVYDADPRDDPTRGADHYNNPDKEGYPAWTKNCTKTFKIGNHQFYKGP